MARVRTKLRYATGRVNAWHSYFGTTDEVQSSTSITESVSDVPHPGPPYVAEDALLVRKFVGRPARLSVGQLWYNPKYWAWNLPSSFMSGDYTDMWTFPVASWTNEAIAKVQDTAPEIDVPLAVAELKDLPRTIRSLYSRSLSATRIADLHLTNQFGVRPIVSDVMALLSLQHSLANRVKQHRKKYRTHRAGGALSKGAVFDVGAPFLPDTETVNHPYYGNMVSDVIRDHSHRAWFTARLTPQIDLSETLATVVTNPLGIGQASLETLWNILPWSFLIDYFADIADVLRVQGNLMPYHIDSLSIMCTTRQQADQYPRTRSGSQYYSWNISPGHQTFVEKRRWIVNNPTATLALHPFLSGMQAANISALALSVLGKR